MAGGDGSLATVAAAAAEHDLPFICLPAGTRNHFALDLGIVRHDLLGALDAFTAGLERRIDMAEVNGRPFLNNISLGVYGDAVQRSGYRDAKLQTMLDTLHEVLSSTAPSPELLLTDDLARRHTSPWSCWCRTTSTHWTSHWPRVRGHGSTPADSASSCWTGPATSTHQSLRGARPQSRSRPPRPYPQASTARPSPCCHRCTAQPVPPRCASASHATTRAPRPRPCSRHDNGKVLMERAAEAKTWMSCRAQSAPLALPAAWAGVAGAANAGAISFPNARARGRRGHGRLF